MASAVSMNNELLTLWLKASGGLPADEARELVERLAAMEAERNAAEEAEDDAQQRAEEAFSRGYKEAHTEIAGRLQTLIEKHGDDDVPQEPLWSLHTDLECEGR